MIRQALVLAAGLSRRMGGVKQLLSIGGKPLIWYPLASLHYAEASEVCIVARRQLLGDFKRIAESIYGSGSVYMVVNERPELENGYSLVLGLTMCPLDPWRYVYVSMSDHIYTPRIPFLLAERGWGAYIVAADRSPVYVDVAEATRVLSDGLYGYAVGKNLSPWSHVDCGVHAALPRPTVERALSLSTRTLTVNMVTNFIAHSGELGVAGFEALPWTEVDTPEDFEQVSRGRRGEVVKSVESWLRS